MLEVPLAFWIGFIVFVLAMLALDLGVFNRKVHVVSVREAGVITRFVYLEYGLAAILVFVGGKMILSGFWHPPTWLSLLVIVGILAVAIIASLLTGRTKDLPGPAQTP